MKTELMEKTEVDWISILYRISNLFTVGSNINEILKIVLNNIGGKIEASMLAVWLLDENGNFYMAASYNIPKEYIEFSKSQKGVIRKDEGLIGLVVEGGEEPLFIKDVLAHEKAPEIYRNMIKKMKMEFSSLLSSPLVVKGRCIGALNFYFGNPKEEISEVEKMIVKIMSDQIAGFIRNSQVFEEADKVKSEFISIAAHQLRTPLSSIKWILKMILDGDLGKLSLEQMEYAKKGYSANERMILLVNDLLDAGRMEEGRFGFKLVSGDINKVVKEVASRFTDQAKIRQINLEVAVGNEPIVIGFDSSRIKMAISNLLDNAIRYTPPEGSVMIGVRGKNDSVEIFVKDTGVGIPEDQKKRVFSKFFRADNVIRMQTDGTGLGLYLCKNIAEKHGGKIWFESKEDRGTTFYISIPRKK
ncbi:MAG: GAF domain-containing sensor histidine kinase [Patescibacteria group bacterium]